MRTLKIYLPLLALFSLLSYCKPEAEEYLNAGKAKLKAQHPEEALSFFEESLKTNPKLDDAWNAKGVAHFKLHQNAQALSAFGKAIALNPKDYRYFYNRGNLHRKLGSNREAIEDYTTALSLDSLPYEIYLNRALAKTSTQAPTDALADFDHAARLSKQKDPAVLFYRGKALGQIDRHAQAIRDFRSVLRKKPAHKDAAFQLALSLQALNRTEEACTAMEKALKNQHPKAQAFLDTHCMAQNNSNQNSKR